MVGGKLRGICVDGWIEAGDQAKMVKGGCALLWCEICGVGETCLSYVGG